MAELTDYQKDILIRTALGEARGEGVDGMADVIQVVFNRANSGKFPSDPAKVALQDKQFSTWNSGEGGNNPQKISANSKIYKTAAQALEAVMGGRPDPTGGALYYHTPAVNPSWAKGANTNGKIERNGHVFYPSRPVPPGEIPEVATALFTVPTPPATPMPPRPVGRDNLITQTMAQLRKPSPQNAGDSLALNPVQGGKTGGPMFDAAYDTTSQAMRTLHNPIQSGGMAWGDTAPTPARRSEPERVVSRLPDIPAPRDSNPSISDMMRGRNGYQTVATIPSRLPSPVTASDRTRGNEMQTREIAQTIQTIPTTGGIGQSPVTRSVQSVPVQQFPQVSEIQRQAAIYGQGGPTRPNPYRDPEAPPTTPLPPLPPLQGFDVANKDQSRLVADISPMAPGGEVPIPGMPGSIPTPGAMPPMPYARPQPQAAQLPPMPRQRPSFLGQQIMPQALPQKQAPLRITVNGGNVQQAAPRPAPTPQGYTDTGNGRLVSKETGGVYYTRHLPSTR